MTTYDQRGQTVYGDQRNENYNVGIDPDSVYIAYAATLPIKPIRFIPRPALFREMYTRFRDSEDMQGKQKTIVTLVGGPGFGKTTLAWHFHESSKIKKAYPDGIFWITIGPQSEHRDVGLQYIASKLGSSFTLFQHQDLVLTIANRLDKKRCLIVLDDVWESKAIDTFLQHLPADFLITTRHSTIADQYTAHPIHIEQMVAEEAVEILRGYRTIPNAELAPQPEQTELRKLAERLGYWPLLLSICGHWLRRELNEGRSFAQAIEWVNRGLDEQGPFAFDPTNPTNRNQAFRATMGLSWNHYTKEERKLFCALLAFREQEAIPEQVVAHLWSTTAGLKQFEAEKRIRELSGCFFQHSKAPQGEHHVIHIHSLIREYLARQWGKQDFRILPDTLLDAYNVHRNPWHTVDDDGYLYDHLIYHLQQAQRDQEVFGLFDTVGWTKKRHKQGLFSDFGATRTLAVTKSGNGLANAIRVALFDAVLQALYHNLPVAALSPAVAHKLVSSNLLLSALRSMQGKPAEKLQTYFSLRAQIPDESQERFALEMYTIATEISEPDVCAISIERMIPHLPEQMRVEANRLLWQTIFAIDDLEARSTLLKHLCQHLMQQSQQGPSPQLNGLLEDVSKLKEFYRKISILEVILSTLPETTRAQVWKAIYPAEWKAIYSAEVENCRNQHTKVERFSTLVRLLPPKVHPPNSQDIWPVLNAVDNWEVIFTEFKTLLPHVPIAQIPEIWNRIQAELNSGTLDYHWQINYLIAIVEHLPDHLLAEFQAILPKYAYKNKYQAAWEVELAKRLPNIDAKQRDERYVVAGKIAITGDGDIPVQDIIQKLPTELTPQLWEYAINEFCVQWNSKDGLEQARFYRRIGESLSALANCLPEKEINKACSDCINRLEWFNYPQRCADLLSILINRVKETDKFYENVIDQILGKPESKYASHILCAYALIEALPQLQTEKYLSKLLSATQELQDVSRRAASLISHLHLYPLEKQVELWSEAWHIAIGLNQMTDNSVTLLQLVQALPLMCSPQELMQSINFKEFTHKSEAVEYVVSHAQSEELVALIVLAPHFFANRVWHTLDDRINRIEYVWLALFPHLTLEEQEQLLPKILRQSCSSEKVTTMQQIGLFRHWSGQHLMQAWQEVCTGIDESNDYKYTPWAWMFLKQIPESHLYPAWQLALKNISPTWWPEWPAICEELARRLPQHQIRQAWLDIEDIQQRDKHFRYYVYQLKTALASRLPSDMLSELISHNAQQTIWPADIFTCRLDKYLRYGGIWLNELEPGQRFDNLLQEGFQGMERRLALILLHLWSYAAYLFVPLLWVVQIIFGPLIKNIHWGSAIQIFYSLRNLLPFQLSMIRHFFAGTTGEKIVTLFLLPLLPIGIVWTILQHIGRFLAPYNAIAAIYALPPAKAKAKILEHINTTCTMEELMSLRPLIQRAGGIELRMRVAAAYLDAHTWWMQKFT